MKICPSIAQSNENVAAICGLLMATRMAIDIGGTFTDVIVTDNGRPISSEIPSPTTLYLTASQCVGYSSRLHASTVATNTNLGKQRSRAALVSTRGFRDCWNS